MKPVIPSVIAACRRAALLIACVSVLTACAHPGAMAPPAPVDPQSREDQPLTLFSGHPAGALPTAWEPLVLMHKKKTTAYGLVKDGDRTVLRADADQSSSGLRHAVDLDPYQQPWLTWRWKSAGLIRGADNTQRDAEDAPVRIVLAFDGDKRKLSFLDAMLFETAKLVSGHDFPYATLMYIWENRAPKETVIANTRTGRIRMLVAESGPKNLGKWMPYQRNIVDDYIKVYGEPPGRLIAVGVLTDTDNTAQQISAWYGDIRLQRQLPSQHAGN